MDQSPRPVVGALHTSACNTRNTRSSSSSGIDTTHHDHQPQQTPPAATTKNTSSGNTRSSTHTSGSPPLPLRACQCMWHRPLAVWCTRGVVLFQQCSSPSCLQGTAPVHIFFCTYHCRAVLGIEPGTSRTRSENHATRPSSQMLSLPASLPCNLV